MSIMSPIDVSKRKRMACRAEDKLRLLKGSPPQEQLARKPPALPIGKGPNETGWADSIGGCEELCHQWRDLGRVGKAHPVAN